MKEFWDQRYAEEGYVYGTEPNEYLRHKLEEYKLKGNILFPADGEGRNSVFAASLGFDVTAFDQSEEGQKKALKLAEIKGVKINYLVSSFEIIELQKNYYDCISLIYAHFPPPFNKKYYSEISSFLKPGGVIIIEGFSKNHLELNKLNKFSCGPQNLAMLFSVDEFEQYFSNVDIIELTEEIIDINEGPYHKGKASVIRFTGRKR